MKFAISTTSLRQAPSKPSEVDCNLGLFYVEAATVAEAHAMGNRIVESQYAACDGWKNTARALSVDTPVINAEAGVVWKKDHSS